MDRERKAKIIRLLLRAMPLSFLFPGPELYDLFEDARKGRTDLEEKVDTALTSIRQASSVVSELEQSLKDRAVRLTDLRAEIERLSTLASIEEAKAAPLLAELKAITKSGRPREYIIGFVINIIAGTIIFLLGARFGPTLFPDTATRPVPVNQQVAPVVPPVPATDRQ